MLFDQEATKGDRRSNSMAQIVGRVRKEVPLQVFPALGEKKRI